MLMVSDVQDIIKRHQAQIITSLKDPDIRLLNVLRILLEILSPPPLGVMVSYTLRTVALKQWLVTC